MTQDDEGAEPDSFLYSFLLTSRCFKEKQIYLDQEKSHSDIVCVSKCSKQSQDLHLSQT